MAKPDFLVIGAQKAGTTWLYTHLSQHDQVWLPPVKEIHYFDRTRRPLMLDAFRGRHQRFMLWRWMKPALRAWLKTGQNGGWYARFFLGPRSDDWYLNCFPENPEQICGDITPAYARLSEDKVAKVARLLPDAKIIYILRNPVDRMWSQAAMYFSRYGHGGLSNQSEDAIRDFFEWGLARANSDYRTAIERWQQHFSPTQFHLCFYDELSENPDEFLSGICTFLGINPPANRNSLSHKVHSRDYPKMPPSIRASLSRDFLPQLEYLAREFPNRFTEKWLLRATNTTR